MTEAIQARSAPWAFVRAIVSGLMIAFAGAVPWIVLASINARVHPEWPLAAAGMFVYLSLFLAWLGGAGPPRATRAARWFNLRLWRPEPGAWRGSNFALIALLALVILAMAPLDAMYAARQPAPDLSPYPTTALRMSLLFMGALVSGVVEEAAFRGYMQSQLERFGQVVAIGVTAAVFVLAHATHGLAMLVQVAPGYFAAGVLYGVLALRSGSILPGIVVHTLGDSIVAVFGTLHGDWRLLIAN
jgi:uncharacterized protein